MNDDTSDSSNSPRSWLDKISLALSGEPKDREELIALLRDAQQRDLLDIEALGMIEGVLEVAEMRVRDVMVPRSQMVVVELDWPLERLLQQVIESGHSRFPVIEDDRDDVLGILIVKDLLRFFAEGSGELELRDFLRPAKFIPESKRLNSLLREFRSTRLHMAIIVDEYGGISGLITIEDVLEQIVGEIDDEHDDEDDADAIRQLDNHTFTIKALTPVEAFNSYFGTQLSADKADTIGGLIMMELGHLPKRNETLAIDSMHFRILRADNRRIHLLELSLPSEPAQISAV